MEGKVKWFDSKKGYGFIENVNGDIFVRYSSILGKESYKELVKGEYVEFILVKTDKGYKAKCVKSKGAIT